jgi:putative ABC transport system substrate-binding protein
MPVIGSLYSVSAADWVENMAGFHRGLSETGFVEGRNVAVEYRWADGQLDRMPAMAADLVRRKAAVILVGGNATSVRAVIAATEPIPIVFTTGTNPVATGLVASLNRPGGHATGVTFIDSELIPKRLELLHEIFPNANRVAVLINPTNAATSQGAVQNAHTTARRLGLEIIVVSASTEHEIVTALATAIEQRAVALIFGADAYFSSRREQIAALAQRHGLPTVSGERESAVAGVLMSYGASIPDSYRQAGIYVGRVLKGEKPANLPVVQPTTFKMVINLKTAKALGLTISPTLLARADEVIE